MSNVVSVIPCGSSNKLSLPFVDDTLTIDDTFYIRIMTINIFSLREPEVL